MKFPVKPVYYTLLLLGIVLQLIPYFINRSLWLDESLLALNVDSRSYAELLKPLAYWQVVPVLFLFIEKTNIILFSDCEYSLRLFPLICGLLSLPLAYRFTKAISGNTAAALLSLFLLATNPLFISYSTEVRQYEGDVFSTLCLFTLLFDASLSGKENKRFILLAIAGSVLIFLSHIVILELFTIGVYFLFTYRLTIFRKRWLIVMFICWTMTFAIDYFGFIRDNPSQSFMLASWQQDFMPFTSNIWVWMYGKILPDLGFYSLAFLAAFILSITIFIVKRQWLLLYILLFPLALILIISGFQMYPFEMRHILYLSAFIIPAISIGLIEWVQAVKEQITKYVVATVLIMATVELSILQLVNTQYPFGRIWHSPEDIKKSIAYIASNISKGQKVYVYFGARPALTYYIKTGHVPFKDDVIYESIYWNDIPPDETFHHEISKTSGEVWVLFSHVYPEHAGDEAYTMQQLLNDHDVILKGIQTDGSAAYLVQINSTN